VLLRISATLDATLYPPTRRVDRSECLQAANAAAQQQAHRGVDDILRLTQSMDQMSLMPANSSANGNANSRTTVNGSSSQQHHRLTGSSSSSVAGAVHVPADDDSESDTDADAVDATAGNGSSEQADEVSYAFYIPVNASASVRFEDGFAQAC
jgi:hypothetical protein